MFKEQLQAIISVGLLFTVLPIHSSMAADPSRATTLYRSNCLMCHGQKADGNGPAAAAMQPPPTDFTDSAYWSRTTTEKLKAAIRDGVTGSSMPSFQQLSDGDRDDLAEYLRSFKK